MDNQHKHIKGYRDLSAEEIDMMNKFKEIAVTVGDACLELREHVHKAMPFDTIEQRAERDEAKRWLEEGEMEAQKAFMCLIRAIARPTTF